LLVEGGGGGPSPALLQLAGRGYASGTRNAAIAASTGKYVLMFDSDDLLRPWALAALVATAERTGADAVVAWVAAFQSAAGASGSVGVRRR
jgi:glycosyltransferase involved in cell wall biosynthesis